MRAQDSARHFSDKPTYRSQVCWNQEVSTPECRVVIASVPDRERVVAEIWCGECQLAELRSVGDELVVELYPHPRVPSWEMRFEDLLDLLTVARQRLDSAAAPSCPPRKPLP